MVTDRSILEQTLKSSGSVRQIQAAPITLGTTGPNKSMVMPDPELPFKHLLILHYMGLVNRTGVELEI